MPDVVSPREILMALRTGYEQTRPELRREWAALRLAEFGRRLDVQTARWLRRRAAGRYSPMPLHIRDAGAAPEVRA